MRKILITYYSRTGLTSAVADEIANACDADLEPIRDIKNGFSGRSYLRSVFESMLHVDTLIRRVRYAPDDYDLIVIGTPIWCWNIASPVRAYIKSHRHQCTRVAFFLTCGGAGQRKVFRDMEKLTGQAPIACLALTDNEIKEEQQHEKIIQFTNELKGNNHVEPAKHQILK